MYTTRDQIEKEEQEKQAGRSPKSDETPLWVPMLVAFLLAPVGFVWGAVMMGHGEEKRGLQVMAMACLSVIIAIALVA